MKDTDRQPLRCERMNTHAVVQLRLVGDEKVVDHVLQRIETVLELDAGERQISRKNRGKIVQYGTLIVELNADD